MGTKDPRVDAYIAKSADFAQPVLRHFRKLVHATCPDVEETIKWGSPFFVKGGGNICGMSAFKKHCGLIFWHFDRASWAGKYDQGRGVAGKITSLADLPSDTELKRCIRYAMKLNADGVKKTRATQKPKPKLAMPADFSKALKSHPKALATFENFPPGKKRDYLEWVLDAKQAATRELRIETSVTWLADGKARYWKYERCK
jgi:uncharacterized protein YdeI (YjbR/CyaY-like superfamily)